ncbi:MAG: FtsQ-type POTRA domain-containing protein [Clostridiales bacterium]|nr:FtsQ-type POTRA domain-containing protein [Clostridiales bacterium]
MKEKEKRQKHKKPRMEPSYIDIFAEDDDIVQPDKPIDAALYRDIDAPHEAYRQDGAERAETGIEDSLPFSFDRFGRRIPLQGRSGRRRAKREVYGRRKDAAQATSLIVRHETEQQRELLEAEERALIRQGQRDRANAREREQQRRVRAAARRKRLAGIGFLFGIALVFALIGYFTFLLSAIDIVGETGDYSKQELIRLSGLTTGKHMLFVDLHEAKENLESDPYLSASVEYVFPNQVQIQLRVRRELAAVRWGPNFEYLAIIDSEGIVLRADTPSSGGLPVVNGMLVSGAEEKKHIGGALGDQLRATLELLRKLDEYALLGRIAAVDVAEPMKLFLITREGHRVEVGDALDLDMKCARFRNHYTAIMDTAAMLRRQGHETVTIYLYSKNGVTVSPYPPDHIVMPDEPTQTAPPEGDAPETGATPNPDATAIPPDYRQPTPRPDIILPNDPFTG